jgi:Family of unknown function (DUF6088)
MQTMTASATNVSRQVAHRIGRSKDRFWTVADFDGLHADQGTVDRALIRLARAGRLRRVSHGLYWRGQSTPFGMTGPDDLAVAARIADVPGVGLAGLSAANDLGLTTQVPSRTTVAVPRRAPKSPPTIRFVDRAARRGRLSNSLNPIEVSVLEVLDGWDQLVDDPLDAADRLVGLVGSGVVRPAKLAAASGTEPARVRARLRTLLEQAGATAAASRVRVTTPAGVVPA